MSALDDQITALTAEVANNTTVDGSALTLIQSIPTLIQNAVNTALANGATPAQLAALQTLVTSLQANDTGLAAAVTANTPVAAPVAPPSTGTAPAPGAATPAAPAAQVRK